MTLLCKTCGVELNADDTAMAFVARVEELEAACAEMRQALELITCGREKPAMPISWYEAAAHALSSSAGLGWLSPEQAEEKDRRIAELERANTHVRERMHSLEAEVAKQGAALEHIASGIWTSSGDRQGATWAELVACRIALNGLGRDE